MASKTKTPPAKAPAKAKPAPKSADKASAKAAPAKAAAKPEKAKSTTSEPQPGQVYLFGGYDSKVGTPPEDSFIKPGDRIVIVAPSEEHKGTYTIHKEGAPEEETLLCYPEEFSELAPEAPKAKKGAKPPKEEPEPVVIDDTAAVKKSLRNSSDLEAAKALVNAREENAFTLGGVLRHIQENKSFAKILDDEGKPRYTADSAGFEQYVNDELDYHPRKAYHLISIYVNCRKIGVDDKKLAETGIGWTKAREIVKVADSLESFEELAEYAAEHTKDEVVEHVKKELVKAGGVARSSGRRVDENPATKVKFGFTLFDDEAAFVEKALEAAGKAIENTDRSQQFRYIVTEWAALSGSAKVPLKKAIKLMESAYGVKLAVEKAE